MVNVLLHPQLQKDTFFVSTLSLCRVLLMNNALYPWVILVPMREGAREITDLSAQDYTQLTTEIHQACSAMQRVWSPDKMNIGALGNMVPQLHVHVIARFKHDAAWPQPVWGQASAPYSDDTHTIVIKQLQQQLASTN